ncbi:MAG: DUF1553 domain-containing protein, partial [Verrucomicrobiota bacterium]
AVFVLKEAFVADGELALEMHFGRHFSSSLGKFRVSVAPMAPEILSGLGAESVALLRKNRDQWTAGERRVLREAFLMKTPALKRLADRVRALRKPGGRLTTLVMQERPPENPRPTYLHHRGEFLSPQKKIEPHLPEVLAGSEETHPTDRLAFARWLVSPRNPLTARVQVNRAWAAFFGRGLVETLDDFGIQGSLPSHPELLDWLAVEFRENGWSRKALHKLIVTSATYKQSSALQGTGAPSDLQDLVRAPRFRLEGEVIRDSALVSAGLLNRKMFGRPVRPPQPDGVTEVAYGGAKWNASEGGERFRRSLYTYMKRTAPFAMFATFDGPSGEACLARRDVSNTPLQALTLMNDPMMVEIARKMGRSLAEGPGPVVDRLRGAFRRVLTRVPEERELALLERFFKRQQKRLKTDTAEAARVVGGGEGDLAERAAWTAVARALFSLDEAITRN